MNENSTKQTAKIGVDTNTIPNNCIWYESANGEIVEPHDCSAFNAQIVSNTYKDGKGIIAFDNDITEIGFCAFEGCASLTSVIIPDSVTEIDMSAFYGCTGLTSVTIPDSVTSIGGSAFSSCTSLASVIIPNSVTEIDESVFSGCTGLTRIYGKFSSEDNRYLVVDGVLNSFAPNGLTEYIIPDSVTSIGYHAFYDCTGLISVTIPDSVTSIDGSAFEGCTGLKSVTISDSVTSIGWPAFEGCTALTNIYCKPTTPPILRLFKVFRNTASNAKIYVPRESVSAYKSADGWRYYASQIVGYDF